VVGLKKDRMDSATYVCSSWVSSGNMGRERASWLAHREIARLVPQVREALLQVERKRIVHLGPDPLRLEVLAQGVTPRAAQGATS